jgi:signal transduction histidine kinase
MAFGIGYNIHAICYWRESWPTAASALTATYFHIGALCFSWGYTSLLNPTYVTKKVAIRDIAIYIIGLIAYWSVALAWKDAPLFVMMSFAIFFSYCIFGVIVFYKTYNMVSYRMMRMSLGNVGSFVRWMQVCCDLIIFFGIGSVAVTGIFPNEKWPYVVLLVLGIGIFGYIVYSLEKYGSVINGATQATYRAVLKKKDDTYKSPIHKLSIHKFGFLLMFIASLATMTLTSCKEVRNVKITKAEADSLIEVAHKEHAYDRILSLVEKHEETGAISPLKAHYWRGYVFSRQRRMRLAENEWKQAIEENANTPDALEYYAKSANRLAGLLFMKFDYEGTIRVAVPAMKFLKDKDYTANNDFANLHTFVGSCQLKLGQEAEAAKNYNIAYSQYLLVTEDNDDISDYTTAIIGIVNIANTYIQCAKFQEAYEWLNRMDSMLERYRKLPKADKGFIDKEWARLNFYKGYTLECMGQKEEAQKTYKQALSTHYAQTAEGQIEGSSYLIAARRWNEAADKYNGLDKLLNRYDMKMTLDNIRTYLVPKFRANVGAHRVDSAIYVATWICNALDTAVTLERKNASLELATIYDMQQKETEIAEQRASLSHQRYLGTMLTLFAVILGFSLFIYFRHQAAMRLESAYRELEVANARAEESSRIKSEFIQQISHEIRTPLNILSGYTQVLTNTNLEIDRETRHEINRQITENTDRLAGLVSKMLELSDARSKTVIEQKDTISPVEIAREAARLSEIEEAKHLTFDMMVSQQAASLSLTTNQEAATRALTLILDNARKFTAPAEALTATNMVESDKKQKVVLTLQTVDDAMLFIVEDTGIGVPPEEANRIFDEFVQLDEYYDGTGIGLTIARSIARRMGGDVVLDTNYTDGARFVMMLPINNL